MRHCSLSHDMTRFSLPTDWSSQVSDSNQPKHKPHFSESCVEYDWRHGGTIFRRVYQVIYEQLQPVGCRRYCPVSESRFSLAVSHCNCSIAARTRAPQLPFPHLVPRLSHAGKGAAQKAAASAPVPAPAKPPSVKGVAPKAPAPAKPGR